MSGPEAPTRPLEDMNRDVEFLFVVLEAAVFEDKLINSVMLEADRWGNYLPPSTWMGYGSEEKVGKVFRYKNGTASPAEGYVWYRPAPHYPGTIGKWNFAAIDGEGNPCPNFEACRTYTTRTVFDGGPFMGTLIKMKDASVNPVDRRENDLYYPDEECCSEDCEKEVDEDNSEGESDSSDLEMGSDDFFGASNVGDTCPEVRWPMHGWADWRRERDSETWLAMKFEHDNGVSRISLGDEGRRYAAGWTPSWIPSIVAHNYTNPDAHLRLISRGLGGDMATVIGLLALTQEIGHCDEAFYLPRHSGIKHDDSEQGEYHQAEIVWKNNNWSGARHPNACGYS